MSSQNLVVPSSYNPATDMEQLYGRHGDIKPANVLLFRTPDAFGDMGILKLTDFGLAEFSAVHSKSYKQKSKVATSPSYRAPECDVYGGVIGRSYDIWTLGCLYLEFATWLLGGWKLVEKFTEKRTSLDRQWLDIPTDTFFEIVKCSETGTPGAMIKPAVTDVSKTTPPKLPPLDSHYNALVYTRSPRSRILHRLYTRISDDDSIPHADCQAE